MSLRELCGFIIIYEISIIITDIQISAVRLQIYTIHNSDFCIFELNQINPIYHPLAFQVIFKNPTTIPI